MLKYCTVLTNKANKWRNVFLWSYSMATFIHVKVSILCPSLIFIPGVNCSQDLKGGRVCGKASGQPKLLPHQDTEEPLRQRLGVRCWSRHTGAQQDLPACWRREVWYSAASPSLLLVRSQVLIDGRQKGSLKGQRSNVSKQQPILKKCAVWGGHVDIQKYCNRVSHRDLIQTTAHKHSSSTNTSLQLHAADPVCD